jgi:quercetin dioxygenase-like cupin family protein
MPGDNRIGTKLKLLRKKKKMTIEQLSAHTGITVEHLREVEDGNRLMPVADIINLSKALTADPNFFLKTPPDKEKKKDRIAGFEKRADAYNYTVLTPESKDKHLRAFRVVIDAKSEHPKVSYKHEGEEFIYVLDGLLEITVGHSKNRLKKGESLHFDSNQTHALKNPGKKKTVLLVVLYTP